MSTSDQPLPIEDLIAHRAWVRGLALALTRDQNEAEDVQQQTWLVALRSPPRSGTSPRGWLGTVARNIVRQNVRQRGTRSRHAAAVAHSQLREPDDPGELTARAELHATVVAAVVALDEPYRRAILLRHFEDVPVREVARRMGTPLETARSRLRRGRALLRERLVRGVGDGVPLSLALLPLTRGAEAPRTGVAGSVAGGALMSSKMAIAAGIALLAAACAWWWDHAPPERSGDAAVASELPPNESAHAPDDYVPVGPLKRVRVDGAASKAAAREPVRAPTEVAATDPPQREPAPPFGVDPAVTPVKDRLARPIEELLFDNATVREIVGRISWHTDVPIDVDLRAVEALDAAKTALNARQRAGGETLGLLTLIAGLEMRTLDDRVVLIRKGDEWTEDRAVQRVVPIPTPTAPAPVRLMGRVVDPDGNAVAGATIGGLVKGFVRTVDDGRFVCDVLPVPHRVRVWAEGYVPSEIVDLEPPYDSGHELELVAGPPAAVLVVRVTGPGRVVLDRAWVHVQPLAGDRVALRPDSAGVATFSQAPPGDLRVKVSARGHAPVERLVSAAARERTNVAIELTPKSLSARLRDERTSFVVDGESLSAAVGRLAERWSMSVRLEREHSRELMSRAVTIDGEDQTIADALRRLCDAAEAEYRVDDETEVVWIRAAD